MPANFNYISFGNDELVRGNVNSVRMGRSRMFEYTPPDIAKRLEDLGPQAVDFLGSLPAFLCSEIGTGKGPSSMVVKFGRLTSVGVGDGEVVGDFEALIDFDDVEFEDRSAAQETFGADRYQLHRTHWAVREGRPEDVLERLKAHRPDMAQAIDETIAAANDAAAEPPNRDKNILGSADSVEDFLKLVFKWPSERDQEIFFRGHSDSRYELTPSLLRKWPNGNWQLLPDEDRLCKELLIAHHGEFQADEYCFDRLVRMQHYGLPTRLLDISGNPLVALFFACEGAATEHEQAGEVILFRIPSEAIKYYDSDTASCLSNLSNLSFEQKNELDLDCDRDAFNVTETAGKLLHHIKSEKGYFEPRIDPKDLRSIICIKAKQTNSRIKSQDGAFLLFGHEVTMPDKGIDGIEVARVTIEGKANILDQLDRININATTVYPSIDRTAVHLRERYQIARKPDPSDD